ncbi:MAG: hypothetical protein IT518_07295 [Burkholderiales bacterium]|nr:hypothetical protein [Burkholderiales bacterium]
MSNSTSAAPTVLPLIEARGTRFEIGYIHGESAAALAHGTLDWSFRQLQTAGMGRDAALAGALRLLDIVRASTPELVEEVRGIAEGARMTLAEGAVINTRYELLFVDGARAAMHPRGECTLLGVEGTRTADGNVLVAQNVDLDATSARLWVMLCVRPPGGPRILTATLAGMLAQEGINSAGLALCGSMIRCAGWRAGYPSRKFLRRRVLEQPTVARAIETIRRSPPRASSHNLMLADAEGDLVDVETTLDDVRLVRASDGLLAHSNHYVSPGSDALNACIGDYLRNSQARRERMARLLADVEAAFTPAIAMTLLRDHGGGSRAICRHADRDEVGAQTNVAVVAQPARRRLHVALGPPCRSRFTTYEIDDTGVTLQADAGFANPGERHVPV